MKEIADITLVSGGQTGADRAGLDFAIKTGLSHGGWCPKGRLAEDGILEAKYQLKETSEEIYEQRTEWNVRDSDATVIFACDSRLTGGTLHTKEIVEELGKPLLVLIKNERVNPAQALFDFIKKQNIKTLNVAGPRASKEPEVYDFVTSVLSDLLQKTKDP